MVFAFKSEPALESRLFKSAGGGTTTVGAQPKKLMIPELVFSSSTMIAMELVDLWCLVIGLHGYIIGEIIDG